MGNGHHRARIARKELLQPVHRLGIQVIGRLVQQQHVRLGQQQAAQGDTALLAARQQSHLGFPWRQAQGVGGDLKLVLGVSPRAANDGLHLGLLFGERVEISVFFAVSGVDFFQPRFGLEDIAHARFNAFAHGLLGVQLRLLRQITNIQTRHGDGFAFKLLVNTRHDLEQGGLAGTIGSQNAYFGAREEAEGNVFENELLRRNDLAEVIHGKYVLSHGVLRGISGCKPDIIGASPDFAPRCNTAGFPPLCRCASKNTCNCDKSG